MIRDQAFDWLRGVGDEYDAVKASLELALRRMGESPREPDRELELIRPSQMIRTRENLQATYIVRLFAGYEAVLRDYWVSSRPGRRPPIRVLMAQIAFRENVPQDWLSAAHLVRELRNDIVHHRVSTPSLTFQHCGAALRRYLSGLPLRW